MSGQGMINFQKLKEEYEKISQELSYEHIIKDRGKYQKLTRRFSFLDKIISLLKVRDNYYKEKKQLQDLISNSQGDAEVRDLAHQELIELDKKINTIDDELEDKLFEEDEPQRDVIIEIRAAAGGEESALFAVTLFKMYSRYIEKKKWDLEVLSSSPTEIGGFKEIVFSVKGKGAYTNLKFESGVHRVQRVPVTESGGRIHTSTVTVAVLVEPKEVELKINPEDLRIDTFRSSGAGGQHVNVTDSAVRITYIPLGIVVSCQDERSQIKNREKAMRVIKARIMERKKKEETDKITSQRRTQIGSGERSEKIRTYNFSERRVTDHRINFTMYRLEQMLEGDMDEVIIMLVKEERKKIYEAKGLA